MKKAILYFLTAAALISIPSLGTAKSAYMNAFDALYPNAGLGCSVCHTSVPALNSYGTAFSLKHTGTVTETTALVRVEALDSDADGYTNLTEILAPTPTQPAVKTSAPTTLMFYDNFKNATATAIPNWLKSTATWAGNSNFLNYSPTGADLLLVNAAGARAFTSGTIFSNLKLTTGAQAYIVFSLANVAKYRYVQISETEVIIGQVGAIGGAPAGIEARASIAPGTSLSHKYTVEVSPAGLVSVRFDSAASPVVSYTFPSAAAGKVGLRTAAAAVSFDDFSVAP